MKISFDLDDTLIPGIKSFPTESQNWFQKLVGIERLRLGTPQLFSDLKQKGYSIGIYTTSFRSEFSIRLMFLTYGIYPDFVINQKVHNKVMNGRGIYSSKYPPAFQIEIHVDDSKGVEIEGAKFQFRTIIIQEGKWEWTSEIIRTTESLD